MTVKQLYAALLALCGAGCLMAAGILYGKNFSDAIHMRKTKARRAFQAGAFEAHPKLNPGSRRASRMFLLVVVALACFAIALAVTLDS